MSNKYFVRSDFLQLDVRDNSRNSLYIGVPVLPCLVDEISIDVEDNFISRAIEDLLNLGKSVGEIANDLCLNKALIELFVQKDCENKKPTKGIETITKRKYVFANLLNKKLMYASFDKADFDFSRQRLVVQEESATFVTIRKSLASSDSIRVSLLDWDKANNDFCPTDDDLKDVFSKDNSDDSKIVSFNYIRKEPPIYLVTKVIFLERNLDDYFVLNCFKGGCDPILRDSTRSGIANSPYLREKVASNLSGFKRHVYQTVKMVGSNSFKEEFDQDDFGKYGALSKYIEDVFIDLSDYQKCEKAKGIDIENKVDSVISAAYNAYEETFLCFIGEKLNSEGCTYFDGMLSPQDPAAVTISKITAFVNEHYGFVVDRNAYSGLCFVDGSKSLDYAMDLIRASQTNKIDKNIFNLLFISLISALNTESYKAYSYFSENFPYLIGSLWEAKRIRNPYRHRNENNQLNSSGLSLSKNKEQLEEKKKLANMLVSSLTNFLHSLLGIHKPKKADSIAEEPTTVEFIHSADEKEASLIDSGVINSLGVYKNIVAEINDYFIQKARGTEILDDAVAMTAMVCRTLLEYLTSRYGPIDTNLYAENSGMEKTNVVLAESIGSKAVFAHPFSKNGEVITKGNFDIVMKHGLTRAFMSCFGFMAEHDKGVLNAVLEGMPDIVGLFVTFTGLRQHNQIVEETFYDDYFDQLHELVSYSTFAEKLENIKTLGGTSNVNI